MCVTYLPQFKKIICSPFSGKVYLCKKSFNKIKTIYPTFVHFKLFVIFHRNETFLVGRIFFDEIKMVRGFGFRRISINFAPQFYTKMSLSQFVYSACDWLKLGVGKDGCVGKLVGGHYSGNFKKLWVWQPLLDKLNCILELKN